MPLEINITDITGSTGTEAEFSASFLNVTNTSQSVGIEWDFISVPTASQIAKILPLPDNSVAGGWTDMSDNTTLFHFNDSPWRTSAAYQLPDNKVSGSFIDMANNIGLWHLNGNADDTSGEGNDGTITGATPSVGITLFSGSTEYTGSYNFGPRVLHCG